MMMMMMMVVMMVMMYIAVTYFNLVIYPLDEAVADIRLPHQVTCPVYNAWWRWWCVNDDNADDDIGTFSKWVINKHFLNDDDSNNDDDDGSNDDDIDDTLVNSGLCK